MPAEALQSANISCAHESCLVIQLKPIKSSGIVNRSTCSVQPGAYRLVLRYSIILTCTALFEYVLFPPSTYSVRIFSPKYVLTDEGFLVR